MLRLTGGVRVGNAHWLVAWWQPSSWAISLHGFSGQERGVGSSQDHQRARTTSGAQPGPGPTAQAEWSPCPCSTSSQCTTNSEEQHPLPHGPSRSLQERATEPYSGWQNWGSEKENSLWHLTRCRGQGAVLPGLAA